MTSKDTESLKKPAADFLSHVAVYIGLLMFLTSCLVFDEHIVPGVVLLVCSLIALYWGFSRARIDKSKSLISRF